MKNKLKKNLKKIGTFFLSLLTLFSSLFGGLAGMPTPITNVSAKEGTATVSMSKARGSFGIRELGRASSEAYGRSKPAESRHFVWIPERACATEIPWSIKPLML